MGYYKQFKLKIIRYYKAGNSSISHIARKVEIPKQTLARWLRAYRTFGEKGLENKKAGAKEIPISAEIEKLVHNLWKKQKRSIYRMRIDLKKNGYIISERQLKKIYKKHKL